MEQHEESSQPLPYREEPHWRTLLGRIVEDLSRVLQMEARLLEANLSRVFITLFERSLSHLIRCVLSHRVSPRGVAQT